MVHSAPFCVPVNPDTICKDCLGTGQMMPDGAVSLVPCDHCDGLGRVAHVEPSPRRVTTRQRRYVATVADGVLDEGTTLDSFIRALLDGFPNLDEDVACWAVADNRGPRLVAVLTPSPDGPEVRYL